MSYFVRKNIIPPKKIERIVLLVVFFIATLGVYFSRTDLGFYEGTWVREDGLVEYLTVLALFIGMIVNLYRAKILRPFRSQTFIAFTYFAAFVFFFGLGEEISWGQRIIEKFVDFQVPDFFAKYNAQGETNLHNLKFGDIKINKLVFGKILGISVAFYFLILPTLYCKVKWVKKGLDTLGLPLPRLYHTVTYLFLAALCELIVGGKKGEILEFGGCWITLLVFFEPYNREIFSRITFKR